jgi:hypothetical protein
VRTSEVAMANASASTRLASVDGAARSCFTPSQPRPGP